MPLVLDLLTFLGCFAGSAVLLGGAWFLINVAVPQLERRFSGRSGFAAGAEARARELFLSKLDAGQRRSWLLRRRFTVDAASGTRYTVVPYDSYNIRSSDALFCLQVAGHTPVYDKLLAQKLLLECDESLFLATANIRTYSNQWQPRREAARRDCAERGYRLDDYSLGVVAASERTP